LRYDSERFDDIVKRIDVQESGNFNPAIIKSTNSSSLCSAASTPFVAMDATIAMYLSRKEKLGLTDSETLLEESDSCGDTVSHRKSLSISLSLSLLGSARSKTPSLSLLTHIFFHIAGFTIGTHRQSK
jgi:hypothetical protein